MKTMRYVYWQHEEMWLGYLEEFPDYWTQGETLEEILCVGPPVALTSNRGQCPGFPAASRGNGGISVATCNQSQLGF